MKNIPAMHLPIGLHINKLMLIGGVALCFVHLSMNQSNAQNYPRSDTDVTTYHYDSRRTGWNQNETVLTTENVNSSSFRVLHSVALDDQVDAQPLVVTHQRIRGLRGRHDLLYVVTANNTVYALDADTGAVLLTRRLGPPVPQERLPGKCNNNGPNIGITSTPVIDREAGTMYVIPYTLENGQPVYRIHALDLRSLDDKVEPVRVAASHTLTDGTRYAFRADVSRQRPALLQANGNIYAAFGSFCDYRADVSRGWLLGWRADTLEPLRANELVNVEATSPHNYFLSGIWMSGYGVAAGPGGALYFVTGNSDPSGTTYHPPLNLQQSVVKMSGDLTEVLDYFTPSGPRFGVSTLDRRDEDFGSGGVMIVPGRRDGPPLAVAAGKVGRMYLLDRSALGGYDPGTERVLGVFSIGACWCGPSFFVGADNVRRIVSSGGQSVMVWRVEPADSDEEDAAATLTKESVSATLATGQDPGFFTSISSDGTEEGTAVIWAVGRPTDTSPALLTLYAFDARDGRTLFSAAAGSWPLPNHNANVVPVVANGKVYVASYKALNIFGLNGQLSARVGPSPSAGREHQTFGTVAAIQDLPGIPGGLVTLRTRTGALVQVDTSEAQREHASEVMVLGRAVGVRGLADAAGVVHAEAIVRAKDSPALWHHE